MNNDLFERVLIQLQPELAQELGCAILEDKKKLQALEIITEKGVDVYVFKHSGDLQTYNDMVDSEDRKLTQEEFDFLKKVLFYE